MSWQEEMQASILTFLVRTGTPVDPKPSPYGWIADDYSELHRHMASCSVDQEKSSWEDSDWSDFAGTFAEPPWQDRHGIDATITCACGQVAGRVWRYSGSHGELLRAITEAS